MELYKWPYCGYNPILKDGRGPSCKTNIFSPLEKNGAAGNEPASFLGQKAYFQERLLSV